MEWNWKGWLKDTNVSTIVAVVAIIIVLTATIGVQNTCSHWRDSKTDELDAEFQQKFDEIAERLKQREAEIQATNQELERINLELAESRVRIANLEEIARRQDEQIKSSRASLSRARSRPSRILNSDESDRRLRELYPEP